METTCQTNSTTATKCAPSLMLFNFLQNSQENQLINF